MRKLVTKISDVLPFGKTFFVLGAKILGNGVNDLENGRKNGYKIKNPAPQIIRGAGKKQTYYEKTCHKCMLFYINI